MSTKLYKKFVLITTLAIFFICSNFAFGATTAYKRTALIGGGATALDGIVSAGLLDLDFAIVISSGYFHIYQYDDDNGGTDNGYSIIAPDDIGAGDGRWVLSEIYASGAEYLSKYATPQAAITAIGATETRHVIDEDVALTASVVSPSTTDLEIPRGVTVTLDSTYDMTINGPFKGSPGCFNITSTGRVKGLKYADVKWFIASAGDGSTDCTAAFEYAEDAVADTNGVVFAEGGTYIFDAQWAVTHPIRLQGSGTIRKTILKPKSTMNDYMISVYECWRDGNDEDTSASTSRDGTGKNGFEIRDITIEGDRGDAAGGIIFEGRNDNFYCDNLSTYFLTMGSINIGTSDSLSFLRESNFDNFLSHNCGDSTHDAIYISTGTGTSASTNQLRFNNARIIHPQGVGIRITCEKDVTNLGAGSAPTQRIYFNNTMVHGSDVSQPDEHLVSIAGFVDAVEFKGFASNSSTVGYANFFVGPGTIYSGTTTSAGDVSGITAIDSELGGYADDFFNGDMITITSGACSGEKRTITDFATTSGTITTAAFSAQIASGVTFNIGRKPKRIVAQGNIRSGNGDAYVINGVDGMTIDTYNQSNAIGYDLVVGEYASTSYQILANIRGEGSITTSIDTSMTHLVNQDYATTLPITVASGMFKLGVSANGASPTIYFGDDVDPNSLISAPPRSLYLSVTGTHSQSVSGFWIKTAGTGNTGWLRLQYFLQATAANLADVDAAINKEGKWNGMQVFDVTNDIVYWSTGATDNSPWFGVDYNAGTPQFVVVTPS